VLDGDPAPPKRAQPLIIGPCLLWPNSWIDQDSFGREVDLGSGDIVLNGDPAPPKGAQPRPQFLAHVCCGQTAGWNKMPLGMEVGLRPGHRVRWDPAPPKGAQPQLSAHVCCGQMAGWTKMPLGTKVGLGPGHSVLDGDAAAPKKGHSPHTFWTVSIVAKRLDGSGCHLVRR